MIYVAPERLPADGFLEFAQHNGISLLAVDEAHCVSQWGQDVRPSYLAIAQFVEKLPVRPTVGAFTATATAQVKEDIQRLLQLRDPLCVTTGFDRPNLYFAVVQTKKKDEWLADYLSRHAGQSGIVYCATRKTVEQVCGSLLEKSISVTRYHAGLSDAERRQNQEDFVFDRAQLMVATNAFGMGIDKSNVSFVIHYNMPRRPDGLAGTVRRRSASCSTPPAMCAQPGFSSRIPRATRTCVLRTGRRSFTRIWSGCRRWWATAPQPAVCGPIC